MNNVGHHHVDYDNVIVLITMQTQSLALRDLSGRANLWISRRRVYLYGHYPRCRCEYHTVGIIGIWEIIQTRYLMLKLKNA